MKETVFQSICGLRGSLEKIIMNNNIVFYRFIVAFLFLVSSFIIATANGTTIRIERMGGLGSIEVDIDECRIVLDLKNEIFLQHNIAVESQRLLFDGEQLQDCDKFRNMFGRAKQPVKLLVIKSEVAAAPVAAAEEGVEEESSGDEDLPNESPAASSVVAVDEGVEEESGVDEDLPNEAPAAKEKRQIKSVPGAL
jgi:hypothetical protein